MSKKSKEDIKEFVESNGYNLIDVGNYKNCHSKIKVLCNKNHLYSVEWNNFRSGQRCPMCNDHIIRDPLEIKKYVEKHGFTLLSEFKGSHSKITIKCSKGHITSILWHNFKHNKKCKICSIEKRSSLQKIDINEVKKRFNELEYIIIGEYVNTNKPVLVMCSNGHKIYKSYNSIVNRKTGCPICKGNYRYSQEEVKEIFKSEGYVVLDRYVSNKKKMLVECNKGHKYYTTLKIFKNGHRCPICMSLFGVSPQEKEILSYIKNIYNGIILENDKTQIYNPYTGRMLEIDIWIPELRKGIEYNGKYWHSFPETIRRDKIKKIFCDNNNIDLLIIDDVEWKKNKNFEKIKQFIGV